MYNFQKEYHLKAHSPLIHFQYDSNGATLRATEVKPKLDRYILKHCKDIPEEWIRDDVNGKKRCYEQCKIDSHLFSWGFAGLY